MDSTTPRLPEASATAPGLPELGAVIDALLEDHNSAKKLIRFCLWHLGNGCTAEDAEDALYEFYSLHRHEVIDTFRPGPQSPEDYFKYCLKRFCWDQGKKIRNSIRNTESIEQRREYEEDGSRMEIPIPETRERWNPEAKMLAHERERKSEADLLRLPKAINRLQPEDRELIRLVYWQKMEHRSSQKVSLSAASQGLGITPNNAKQRHLRVIGRLRRIMKVKT